MILRASLKYCPLSRRPVLSLHQLYVVKYRGMEMIGEEEQDEDNGAGAAPNPSQGEVNRSRSLGQAITRCFCRIQRFSFEPKLRCLPKLWCLPKLRVISQSFVRFAQAYMNVWAKTRKKHQGFGQITKALAKYQSFGTNPMFRFLPNLPNSCRSFCQRVSS